MAKVFLGVGHGGNDPGAVKYLIEKDVNLNMALGCRDYLVEHGVQVGMSRTKDENDTLNEEIKECNAYDPDVCVDIHNNAGGGDGFEAYYHHLGGRSKTLAQNIEAEVKAIGQNSRGCKTRLNSKGNADYYGFIRETKASAVIVEGLFVDNATDVKIADTVPEQRAFGAAIARGILKTLGIKDKDVSISLDVNPSYKVYQVTANALNIRSKSNASSKILGQFGKGNIVCVFETEGDWGRTDRGWINLKYTTWNKNNATTVSYSYYPACDKKHTSFVDALNSIGVDSSKENRKRIAVKNGIKNYAFTGDQNNALLSKLKAGRLIKA